MTLWNKVENDIMLKAAVATKSTRNIKENGNKSCSEAEWCFPLIFKLKRHCNATNCCPTFFRLTHKCETRSSFPKCKWKCASMSAATGASYKTRKDWFGAIMTGSNSQCSLKARTETCTDVSLWTWCNLKIKVLHRGDIFSWWSKDEICQKV